MKIAIIGAGIAGLATTRRALEYNLDCTVFEKTDRIGGTWVYHEIDGHDENEDEVRNALYANLRTNLPRQLMEFPGYKLKPKSGLSYPRHDDVLQYLEDFADAYKLRPHIKFRCSVTDVSRRGHKWHVTVKNLKHSSVREYSFDSVVVCSGYNGKPYVPYLMGMDTFRGHLIHSKYYRRNTSYRGKRVLIVGGSFSGWDIALECAQVTDKVTLSYDNESMVRCDLSDYITLKRRIDFIDGSEIFFVDGTSITVDAIILCTGYQYDFPFLNRSCGIEISNGEIVKPLYKSFINIVHPTMCFISILKRTMIFPTADLQAQVFMKTLINRIRLPPTDVMLEALHQENQQKLAEREPRLHYFQPRDRKFYLDDLATFGETKLLPPVLFQIFTECVRTRARDFLTFRDIEFEVIDDDTFVYRRNRRSE